MHITVNKSCFISYQQQYLFKQNLEIKDPIVYNEYSNFCSNLVCNAHPSKIPFIFYQSQLKQKISNKSYFHYLSFSFHVSSFMLILIFGLHIDGVESKSTNIKLKKYQKKMLFRKIVNILHSLAIGFITFLVIN